MSLFLHQTTTPTVPWSPQRCCICLYSYIKPQQSSNVDTKEKSCICLYSYIKPQLLMDAAGSVRGCICLYSYIKPQQSRFSWCYWYVVYVSIPTSNHNRLRFFHRLLVVVYVSIPTSNHNFGSLLAFVAALYMSLFLHQTTTVAINALCFSGCICLYSYIKPQLLC